MRHVLPIIFVSVGTFAIVACSSDETPDNGDAGTIAPLGDGGGGGDDDDVAKDCSGSTGFDCTKLAAHIKEKGCAKFDEAQYKKDCAASNCGNVLSCEKENKALGDCLLAEPAECTAEGGYNPNSVPAPCDGANRAVFDCLIESGG